MKRRRGEYEHGKFNRIVHGIESNLENLRSLRKTLGFLREHGEGLEKTIKAQQESLGIMLGTSDDTATAMLIAAAPEPVSYDVDSRLRREDDPGAKSA